MARKLTKVDLFIIGGGINGVGIARDAAGRGLKVVLCEKNDLSEGTSSRSGKLVHGGLRYLEYYEFRLVREALTEREVLMRNAPHIIWPMRFVLPHSPSDRPAWLIRLGLFLYDHFGGRKKLPATRILNLRRDLEGAPLLDEFKLGFEYSDCWVDDARLVVLNAIDAAERGANVLTRTECTSARRTNNGTWHLKTLNSMTFEAQEYEAKLVVNAAGPWVTDVINRVAGSNSCRNVRLVKGSHIIVPKFWEGQQAYLIQNTDKRVIFINPYEGNKALIGTTDIQHDGDAQDVQIDNTEIQYLLEAVNRYFKEKLVTNDVLETFSGVRPLFDDGKGSPSAVTRDYVFDLDQTGDAPLLSIFGGKITTFRELAERGMKEIQAFIPEMGGDWTESSPLPGGNIQNADFDAFRNKVKIDYSWMPKLLREHLARLYGTRISKIVGDAKSIEDLGIHFGGQFYEIEARYLLKFEWAKTAEDILWRRTKHKLNLTIKEQEAFRRWLSGISAEV